MRTPLEIELGVNRAANDDERLRDHSERFALTVRIVLLVMAALIAVAILFTRY